MAGCSGITGAGERCRAIAITGSDYCHAHHPDREEARRRSASKAGRRGGRGRKSPQAQEIGTVKENIRQLVDDVLTGRQHTSRGNTAAALWHVYLRCLEHELAVREQEELVGRLETLEDATKAREERGRWGA
jgi:hypothetical protein